MINLLKIKDWENKKILNNKYNDILEQKVFWLNWLVWLFIVDILYKKCLIKWFILLISINKK